MISIIRSVRRMKAVFFARNLEYLRDRASFGWNLVFPVLIVFALALVFPDHQERYLLSPRSRQIASQSFSSSQA